MHRTIAAAAVAMVALGCRAQDAAPSAATMPQPTPWPDARSLRVAAAGEERLELRHEPATEPGALPTVQLVLVAPESEQALFAQPVTLERRDALFGARWVLARESAPGERRAVSADGGVSFMVALPIGGERFLCSHVKLPSLQGLPDWPRLPTVEAWAAGVFETAVWSCDRSLARCRSRALANLPLHASDPDADPLATGHAQELRAALRAARDLRPSRALAVALVDAAVIAQPGLGALDLEAMGTLAGSLLRKGPLGREERRALELRVSLARMEAKQTPADQLSPRTSIEALAAALEGIPEAIRARPEPAGP
jgi:hypothetical protein